MHRLGAWLAIACLLLSMSACGGGSSGSSTIVPPPVTYPVSVTVSGLASGTSVTVLDNGTDTLTFQDDSTQQFATQIAANATYSVTVSVQPALQSCTVTGASGQANGPVAVSVACSLLPPPSTSYPAFNAPYPLVQGFQTPPSIIPNPRIIPVFFSNTPDQSATVAFLQSLIVSPEWSALAEYGVGPATISTPVALTSAAPATTTTAGINAYVSANAVSWATLDGSEIFVMYYPSATTITDDPNPYHSYALIGTTQQVPFVVQPATVWQIMLTLNTMNLPKLPPTPSLRDMACSITTVRHGVPPDLNSKSRICANGSVSTLILLSPSRCTASGPIWR